MALALIMPAFNEAPRIGRVLEEMPDAVLGIPVEVTVVDDGSDDETGPIASSLGAVVLRQSPNAGKGAALRRALDFLLPRNPGAVIWMDADGQHLPSSLPALIAPVVYGEADLCVGSRYLESDHSHRAPLNRRAVRWTTLQAVRRLTGFRVTDPFSGFRCFSRAAFSAVHLEGCGYEAELESTFAAAAVGLRYAEVPIPRIYGPASSKMSHRGRFDAISGYVQTIYRWRNRSEVPMRREAVA